MYVAWHGMRGAGRRELGISRTSHAQRSDYTIVYTSQAVRPSRDSSTAGANLYDIYRVSAFFYSCRSVATRLSCVIYVQSCICSVLKYYTPPSAVAFLLYVAHRVIGSVDVRYMGQKGAHTHTRATLNGANARARPRQQL